MRSDIALRLLGSLMEWSSVEAEAEFKRLQILATYKYDQYAEFIAGSRFLENLCRWLQQFELLEERRVAYAFVKERLLFISSAEMERLVEAFFPRFMYYDVLKFVAEHFGVPVYEALKDDDRRVFFGREVRRSLLIGVSDGARTDLLRRFNVNRISNDQVLLSPDADLIRLAELQRALGKDLGDETAKFTRVYLIDDFTASGFTFFRRDAEAEYSGKLNRFKKRFFEQLADPSAAIEEDALIRIHHFLGTKRAEQSLATTVAEATAELAPRGQWFKRPVEITFGHILHESVPLVTDDREPNASSDKPFLELCDKYYDPTIEKPEHNQVNLQYGFKSCGLPLILQHNTPNNSITLLWKESEGGSGAQPMYSLFRRRERH
jgi:hypothetical protein